MRISTSQIFDAGSRNILNGQGSLYKTQNQLSTGRRILTPQDDPVAASQILLDSQAMDVSSQYADNQSNADSQLGLEESRLSSVVDIVQYIREQVIAGSNAAYSDSQRAYIGSDLQAQFDSLFGLANSADASGHYLFSGYQGETQPFQLQTSGYVQYVGDDGQRQLQVGASRTMAVSDSGRDIFDANRSGNGTFVTAAGTTNIGTGVVVPGDVLSAPSWTNHNYQLTFGAGGTTYTITDTTTSTPVGGTYTYATGAAINAIPGISFSISGTPAAGDTFTVAPSTDRSLFATVKDLVTTFNTAVSGNPVAQAAARNTINQNLANLDQVLDNVSRVQASIGSRRSELESLMSISSDLNIQYQSKISKLQDIDYAEAISRFTSQQTQLQAAQKSFAAISDLSLFKYI